MAATSHAGEGRIWSPPRFPARARLSISSGNQISRRGIVVPTATILVSCQPPVLSQAAMMVTSARSNATSLRIVICMADCPSRKHLEQRSNAPQSSRLTRVCGAGSASRADGDERVVASRVRTCRAPQPITAVPRPNSDRVTSARVWLSVCPRAPSSAFRSRLYSCPSRRNKPTRSSAS
jgi:hypothetical protein